MAFSKLVTAPSTDGDSDKYPHTVKFKRMEFSEVLCKLNEDLQSETELCIVADFIVANRCHFNFPSLQNCLRYTEMYLGSGEKFFVTAEPKGELTEFGCPVNLVLHLSDGACSWICETSPESKLTA